MGLAARVIDDPRDVAVVGGAGEHDAADEGESDEGLSGRLEVVFWAAFIARFIPRRSQLAAPTKLVVATLHTKILNYGIKNGAITMEYLFRGEQIKI